MNNHQQPALSPERILAEVQEETGLSDFGASRLVEDFTQTINGLLEAGLNPVGVATTDEWARRTLRNRLQMQRDLTAHPEIAEIPVAAPIVIAGVPRTGTSKLQRMMSADRENRSLDFWKLLNPSPLPESEGVEPDPRIGFAQAVEEMIRTTAPDLWAGHPTPALEAEEDLHLHELTFLGPTAPMRMGAVRRMQELRISEPYMYEYTRLALQYLQWQEGAGATDPRPWILKSPVHIGNLEVILQVFPDATVVHCHRDLRTSMASTARLMEGARGMFTDSVDRARLGPEVLDYWSAEWSRNIAAREKHGERAVDVNFDDIVEDPIAVIAGIYDTAGRQLSQEGRETMLRWSRENARHRHGRHDYDPADYGYSSDAIREAFGDYISYFGS